MYARTGDSRSQTSLTIPQVGWYPENISLEMAPKIL